MRVRWRSTLIEGEFAVGAEPGPTDIDFGMDLTGFTAEANFRAPDGSVTDAAAAVQGAPVDGVVRVTWPTGLLDTAGRWRMEVWVTSATETVLSRRYHFYVRTPLEPPD